MLHLCAYLLLCTSTITCTLGGSSHWIEIASGRNTELKRWVKVYIPSGGNDWREVRPADRELPLVVNFHPMGLTPDLWDVQANFNPLADKERFVVAYPQGGASAETVSAVIPFLPDNWFRGGYTWNAGSCCPGATRERVDDVQFARDLVAKLTDGAVKELSGGAFDIDPSRIYATGGSNGAFMTFRLACQAPNLFAAVAPVAAVLANGTRGNHQLSAWPSDPFDCPKPSKPVPMLITHGTWDPLVVWGGQPLMNFRSADDNLKMMRAFNGIPEDDHGVVTYNYRNAKCTSYGDTDSNVTFCKVDQMGHSWPTDVSVCHLTKLVPGSFCSTSVDATVQAWEFFKRYRLTTTTTTTATPGVDLDRQERNQNGFVSCSTLTSLKPVLVICSTLFLFYH